jgi:hypothetical protein
MTLFVIPSEKYSRPRKMTKSCCRRGQKRRLFSFSSLGYHTTIHLIVRSASNSPRLNKPRRLICMRKAREDQKSPRALGESPGWSKNGPPTQ